jgi:hypothetical protein
MSVVRSSFGNGLFIAGATREEEHPKHSRTDARLSSYSNGHTLRGKAEGNPKASPRKCEKHDVRTITALL